MSKRSRSCTITYINKLVENQIHEIYDNYFLIPLSIENNLIYSFITPSQTTQSKIQFFVVVESRSVLYSSKIICLQIDWFTEYNGIMTEH